jgi:hypothetical protein
MENKNDKNQILNLGNIAMHNPKFTNHTTTETKAPRKNASVFYDAENQTFADEDGSFVSGKEAKKAYEAYLARSGKSRVTAADSVSLEGLTESEKEHVMNTVKILQDAKKKKGK